ncbi:MAG: hypothetical protein CMC82_03760 [Flavobacteriaceae bacterium]|nr:hypothetical protein [Flavobacteriaceae bacterium]
MAYNNNKGPQHSGDIQFEGDPNDVQIDFENDQVSLKAGGVNRLTATSGSVSISGSLTASADIKATGDIHATAYYGDGSNLSGVGGGASSGSARLYSSTGLETSGFLKVSGSSVMEDLTANGITNVGAYSGSSTIRNVGSISSSADLAVTGNIHATAYYGDGSNLSGVGGGAAASGSARVYSTTGLETSGFLKVTGSSTLNAINATTYSGSSTLQAVGAATLGATLAVSGNVNIGGPNQANSSLYVKSPSDNSTVVMFKSPSHDTIFAITGSGKVVIGGIHTSAKLNTSGSDLDKVFSAAATSRGETFYISGSGETFVSGSVILQDVEPTIFFSGSNGSTPLGQIGYNNSNNILIQNNVTNKHIVFKTNDEGTLKEGLRLNGAVPEVVVNEGSSTLVDFRVESDSNSHMLYVDGENNKVGINNDAPSTTLDVIGDISGSGVFTSVGSISSSADVAVSGNIHATAFYGDGSNLSGVGGGGSSSGSARVYSTTGLETSGFLRVSGSTTLAGTLRSAGRTEKTIHSYNFGASNAHFIPMMGTNNESTSGDYRHQFIAPFNGRIRRVYARSKNNPNGDCTAKIFVASDGTEDFNAGGSEIEAQTVAISAANTTGTFTFSGSQHYTLGQIVGIQMTFNANPGDINITCVWEYDDRTV